MADRAPHAVLRVICRDRPGLVADVAGLLFRLGANILHADDHIDPQVDMFFQCVEFTLPAGADRTDTARRIEAACDTWGMRSSLRFGDAALRVAILAARSLRP